MLSVSTLTLADAGMYQCVAENKHGVIYFAAELMVLGKGGILSVPLNPPNHCCQSILKVNSLSSLKVAWISG